MNPNVDDFLQREEKWKNELNKLRVIMLDCMLTEEFKWKQPCYSFQQKNIIILGGFKDHCVVSFFKGALLSDHANILEKPGENSRHTRFIRIKSVEDIIKLEETIRAYIFEAIEIEKAGLSVPALSPEELELVEELHQKFNENPALKKAFFALTPGRQRAYHVAQ